MQEAESFVRFLETHLRNISFGGHVKLSYSGMSNYRELHLRFTMWRDKKGSPGWFTF